MAYKLSVTGKDTNTKLGEKALAEVEFESDTPRDSNARATDYGLGLKIHGKILFDLAASAGDPTIELTKWSQVPAYNADCYRNVELEVVSASQVVRSYHLPQAFVVEYSEELNTETGVGEFYIHLRQKKDENATVAVNGGFGVA